ncbi:MAG: hypothetical protein WC551_00225 [Patescibacteria group bacterium]
MAEIVRPGFRDPAWSEEQKCVGNDVINFRPGCGAVIRITLADMYVIRGQGHSGYPPDLTVYPRYVVYRCPCGAESVHPQSKSLLALDLPEKRTGSNPV